MNDPDDFLTRWSRRKRAAADEQARAPADEQRDSDARPAEQRAADKVTPPKPAADSGTTEPVFDLSKLPPLESITAETDVRAFLAPGVPAELRLAALRRAWAADPKVRDFVGLADYDFDFHTPGAIAGFGPLEMTDELRQEMVRIVTGWQPKPEAGSAETDPAAKQNAPPAQPPAAIAEMGAQPAPAVSAAIGDAGAVSERPDHDQDELITNEALARRNKESAASQQDQPQPENVQTPARRDHGGALPQ
ncbi:MAG: DUF3306 domain-containing protein [Rhizobiales bacterium]|nr:DUF3306 domain-containing protein [Hyphomicrobiales bacterium]